jgi:DNA modification methylase
MVTAWYVTGDAPTVLDALPAGCVDLVATSPPFLRQRAYLPDGHPDKRHEIGQEADPGAFTDALLAVTEAVGRVLAPHGSLAVELGDTHAGSGGAGGDYNPDGQRAGQPAFAGTAAAARRRRPRDTRTDRTGTATAWAPRPETTGGAGWPADKSLCLVPELYRLALAYGTNPLTGRATPRWRVRNVITWCRPNPAVGRDGDKFRRATSTIVVACHADEAGRARYFDGDAVRTPSSYSRPNLRGTGSRRAGAQPPGQRPNRSDHAVNPAGAPLLDWWSDDDPNTAWVIPTGGYSGAHYATFPPALVDPLVRALCPRKVCVTCGEPSRRIVAPRSVGQGVRRSRQPGHERALTSTHAPAEADRETLGWSDCGHDTWRPGIALDPFAGTGTTLAVATGHGHHAIGIDLDPRNQNLALDRVGPLTLQTVTVAELVDALADVVGNRVVA